VLQNIFSLFHQLIKCWSSFAISWCRWNWSHDKDYILGLPNLLCHITQNPNPNCKPVSSFQNLWKKCCNLHQNYFHKKSRLYQPSLNNNAESPNDDHSHRRKSLWTRFIVLMVPVFVFHGTGFSLLFWKFYKLLWSNVWFRFNKC